MTYMDHVYMDVSKVDMAQNVKRNVQMIVQFVTPIQDSVYTMTVMIQSVIPLILPTPHVRKANMGMTVGRRAWQAVKDLPLLMIMCVKNSPGLVQNHVGTVITGIIAIYNVALVRSQTVQ